MELAVLEYPALITKSKKNVYVANCIMKNIICYGKTENQAIENLEKILYNSQKEYEVRVKPLYNYSVGAC